LEPAARDRVIVTRASVAAYLRSLRAHRPLAAAVASFTGAQIGASAAYIVANVLLARSMAPVDYGRVAFGFNIQVLLLLGGGLGLTTAVISEVADRRTGAPFPWPSVLTLLRVRLLAAMLVVGVGALLTLVAGDALGLLAGAAAAAFIIQDFLLGIMKGQLRTTPAAILSLVQPCVFLLFVILLPPRDAEAALAAFVAAFAFSLPPTVALTPRPPPMERRHTRAPIVQLKATWRIAGYGYVMTFLHVGFYVVPMLLFGFAGRFAEAAAFSILISIVRLIPELAASVLQAVYFPRIRAVTSALEADRLFTLFSGLILAALVGPVLGLAVFAEPALHLVFAGRYDHVADFLRIASPLVLVLPIETLLVWTLLALNRGAAAMVAQLARLLIVALATVVFLVVGSSASLGFMVLALVLSVGLSLIAQLVIYVRTRDAARRSEAVLTRIVDRG
jgi:O-antigen/teichoic acid export membrane protein